jgi:hypothetical protein
MYGRQLRWLGTNKGPLASLRNTRLLDFFPLEKCRNSRARLKSLRKKLLCDRRTGPQRLKPDVFSTSYGTVEAVPLQNRVEKKGLFPQALKPCSSKPIFETRSTAMCFEGIRFPHGAEC